MKNYLKFDENDVSKVIVRFSIILVAFIAFSLLAIYSPKYYFEYKKNTESTTEHIEKLFLDRIKFEVNEIVKNIGYRSSVQQRYLKLTFENECQLLFRNIIENSKNGTVSEKDMLKALSGTDNGDSLKSLFTADRNRLIINISGKIKLIPGDHTKILAPAVSDSITDFISASSSLDSVYADVLGNGSKFISVKYSPALKIFYGAVISKDYFNSTLEKIIYEEIDNANLKGSQEYIFVYKLLNPDGGKKFARMIINPNRPDLVGQLIDEDYADIYGFEFRKEFMRQIKIGGEATVSYFYKTPETGAIDRKTSYFKLYPELNWIVAQGYYQNQIQSMIEEDIVRYRKDFITRVSLIFILISVFVTAYYFVFRNFTQRIQETIIRYRTGVEEKNRMLEEEIRKTLEQKNEISEANEYITKLYESVPVGIVLISAEEREIVNINAAGLEILGYEKDELIGKKCNFSFCPALVNKCPVLDEGMKIDNSERIVINKNGKNITVLKKACLITNRNKKYLLESFVDITRIKETEAELIKLKEEAEQASIEKSRFLANMSHEIRTPMNSIFGMTKILSETELSFDQKDLVETIISASDLLLKILNDILDFSKIESGKVILDEVNFSLRQLVDSIIYPYRIKLEGTPVKLSVAYEPSDHDFHYYADRVKIGQILNNLVANSVKFTEAGKIDVIITDLGGSENVHRVNFSVKDTGIGISEESMGKIFERFTQADISTTRKFGGTGLGLTISKRLTEIMGGELTAESEAGKGSVFSFSLDLVLSSAEAAASATEFRSKFSKIDLSGINILIAEDNVLTQKFISKLLDTKRAQYVIVENGNEAIDQLKKNSYDILLLDGQMPEMDGVKTAETIRKSGWTFKDIPIIALTASALTGDRKKFLDAGMNDYISKPIDAETLFNSIIKLSGKSGRINVTGHKTPDERFSLIDTQEFGIKIRQLGKDTFTDILKLYYRELPEKISRIGSALESDDIERVKFESHSLKGVVSNFGTGRFIELCMELEKRSAASDIKELKDIFKKLKEASSQYMIELETFLKTAGK